MIIAMVLVSGFAIARYSILYPNSVFTVSNMGNVSFAAIFHVPFFQLLGQMVEPSKFSVVV